MPPRPDNRLLDGPMTPVACTTCGARVQARKSSWEQTSVQWDATSLSSCAERTTGEGFFSGCTALRASIGREATEGRLPVMSDLCPPSGHAGP
jgi:hypothetical protein